MVRRVVEFQVLLLFPASLVDDLVDRVQFLLFQDLEHLLSPPLFRLLLLLQLLFRQHVLPLLPWLLEWHFHQTVLLLVHFVETHLSLGQFATPGLMGRHFEVTGVEVSHNDII